MLTEELGKLKARLIETGYAQRSVDEDKLLRELEALDNDKLIKESFEKAEQRDSFKSYGGSGTVCRECQRPY